MLNKEKKVQPTSKSGNDAKPIVSRSCIRAAEKLATDKCPRCGNDFINVIGASCCYDCSRRHDG